MDHVAQVRHFNRLITQRIGVLDNAFLGRNRTLAASRLLFEIGDAGASLRDLRNRLGLDSGYLSRLLQQLERESLVTLEPSAEDARVRVARLTSAGRAELEIINSLSDYAVGSLLEPLTDKQRHTLAEAMETVTRLLDVSAVTLAIKNPDSAAAKVCLLHYYQELDERFEEGFEVAQSLDPARDELTAPKGYFIVASLHGNPVGCGGLKCHADYGEIKRLWVDPNTRGLGIGRRLLEKLEQLAREHHLPAIRLDTHRALKEARALYQRNGYAEVPPYNDEHYAHHWFEKHL